MPPAITRIQQLGAHDMVAAVDKAFVDALAGAGTIQQAVLTMQGMSGVKYRRFINNLMRILPHPRYLEVGAWAGSTLCSAIDGNAVAATVIEDWSQFGGPREMFLANLRVFRPPTSQVQVIEGDFRTVDYRAIGSFNVFLFDGPHTEHDHFEGIALALRALDRDFVLIVDDWNWAEVRTGTSRAIVQFGLSMLYGLEVRTTLDDTHAQAQWQNSDWHNGYFIAVLRQSARDRSLRNADDATTRSR